MSLRLYITFILCLSLTFSLCLSLNFSLCLSLNFSLSLSHTLSRSLSLPFYLTQFFYLSSLLSLFPFAPIFFFLMNTLEWITVSWQIFSGHSQKFALNFCVFLRRCLSPKLCFYIHKLYYVVQGRGYFIRWLLPIIHFAQVSANQANGIPQGIDNNSRSWQSRPNVKGSHLRIT